MQKIIEPELPMPYIVTMMDRHAPQGRKSVFAAVADYEKRNDQHKVEFLRQEPDGLDDSAGATYHFRVKDMGDANLLHVLACERRVLVHFEFEGPAAKATQRSYDLQKAKELALLEIRAEGPVIAPTVRAWLDEQGGEPVASLTDEAIRDLLAEKIIEVWDADEAIPAYGYCGSNAR